MSCRDVNPEQLLPCREYNARNDGSMSHALAAAAAIRDAQNIGE